MKSRQRRKSIIEQARAAAARGEHAIARFLFASVDISYQAPVAGAQETN